MNEYEVKVFIEPTEAVRRLENLGACKILDKKTRIEWFEFGGTNLEQLEKATKTKLITKEIKNFLRNSKDLSICNSGGYFRLREQDTFDLTFKFVPTTNTRDSIQAFREFEQVVEKEEANEIRNELESLGFYVKATHEKLRTSYVFENIRFDIDQWPNLPAYVEIEGINESGVERGLQLMGLSRENSTQKAGESLFKEHGIDFWSNLSFA